MLSLKSQLMMKSRMRIGSIIFILSLLSSCTNKNEFISTNGEAIDLMNPSKKGSVCMFISPDCPLSHLYAQPLMSLEETYGNQFTFFAAVPGLLYSSEEVTHFIDSFKFKIPVVVDSTYELTERWNAEITPEIFVTNANGKILYSGSIDNWAIDLSQKRLKPTKFYLQEALEAITHDESIPLSKTQAIGCSIEKI
jgi:thioredoxin-related protein